MPKLIKKQEYDLIEKIIFSFPSGAILDEIQTKLKDVIQPRTLQRRLAQMIKEGRLQSTGLGRSCRYEVTPHALIEYPIPLSTEADTIRHYVQQKIQYRTPIGYERSFLENYIPNETFYLPEAIREKFLKEGKLNHDHNPASTYTKQILNRLLIDLSWNSSRLEGNTYSLLETEHLLIEGKQPKGKNRLETQMILNHKAAINFLAENNDIINYNSFTVLNLHALLSDELLGNSFACGRLRTIPVGISKTVYHPPEIPQLIEECFYKILNKAIVISDPFEQAFFVMVHLPYLQPFEDVNKRVSRLAANISLMKHNLCPLSFIHVPEQAYIEGTLGVYECQKMELLRDLFVFAYERSIKQYTAVQHTISEPDPFRFEHRQQIKEIVFTIVTNMLNKQTAVTFIRQWAENHLPNKDQAKFINIIETELLTLTEGNIARYNLTLDKFTIWHKIWQP